MHKHPSRRRHCKPASSTGRASGFSAAALEGQAVDVAELPFGDRLALVFGNERDGLSPEFAGRCDGCFRIPMLGFSVSFNISVAVGFTLATAMQARRERHLGGDLSETDREALRRRFYALARLPAQRAAARPPRSCPVAATAGDGGGRGRGHDLRSGC